MSRDPLRILHVVFSLEPGGMENGLVNVAARLPREEFETHVCCLKRSGEFAARLPEPANVRALGKPEGLSPATVWKLAQAIRRVRPHVVHSHNFGPLLYSALAVPLAGSLPLLHGEHGQLTGNELLRSRLRLRRWLYRHCRRVHTVSQSLREHLIELGFPADKITPIVNGVDTDRFQPVDRAEARARVGLAATGPVLGIVGRLTPFKGHAALIRAFEQMAAAQPQARLLIVGGGGSEAERIAAQAQASPAAAQIVLTGHQPQPERYYQAMDFLAAPSVHEGLSNAVLEAMACGVPVLCHRACGNAEVVRSGENGWLADLETAEELAAELRRLLAAPEKLAAAGRRARETVHRDFSLDRMAAGYARLYREIAGTGDSATKL